MNEHPENQNEPTLSDEQMDGLLSSFFEREVPKQLNQLPSKWEAIQSEQPMPLVRPKRRSGQTQRVIAGAAALATACLLIFVIANPFGSPLAPDSQTAEVEEVTTPDDALDQDATFNVSSGNDTQAVDDVNTTLPEIDGIDLSPEDEKQTEDKQ